MSRKKHTILKILASCAFGLILAEVGARIFLSSPQIVTISAAENSDARLSQEAANRVDVDLENHPAGGGVYIVTETGRRLRANCHAIIHRHIVSDRRVELHTNSIGYRNREIGKKQGTRILFLGDSITVADYVPETETFVRQVETLARSEKLDWETINAGVGGISLENELHILDETGLALKPDVVVVCFYLNDFQESPSVYVPRLPSVLKYSHFLHHVALAMARRNKTASIRLDVDAWRVEYLAEHKIPQGVISSDYLTNEAAFHKLVVENLADWGGAYSPRAWEVLRPLFEGLKKRAQTHGIRVVIVAFPAIYQVETSVRCDDPQTRLREVADSLSIPVLDLLPMLRTAHKAKSGRLFYDQCHPTTHGNQLIAVHITKFLREVLAGR